MLDDSAQTALLEGAALVRIDARQPGWWRQLPELPAGTSVTMSGDGHFGDLPGDLVQNLSRRGYRVVGSLNDMPPIMRVDVLVPAKVRSAHRHWWRSISAEADRVFDLRMGPVLMVLSDVLAMHLAPQPQ